MTTTDHTQLILKYGSKGGAVHYLQNLLVLEFRPRGIHISVDGIFGQETDYYVKIFQRLHGLTPDGIVGPKTWDKLDDSKDFTDFIQAPMHSGRVGPAIVPKGIIWHYTAMTENTELALVAAWQQNRGRGNGATFLVRRNGQVIQLAPIDKNSNHAGGTSTGRVYFTGRGEHPSDSPGHHPNSVCIGVELSNPGRVRRVNGEWRVAYTGADVVPVEESVYPIVTDEALRMFTKTDKWGWVDYTEAQYKAAREIVIASALTGVVDEPCLVRRKKVNGKDYGEVSVGSMRLGHCDLDPSRKDDPGPLWQVGNLFE
jgi:N-acetyl-anhydromuramyl-L-alanine amidase AmpD